MAATFPPNHYEPLAPVTRENGYFSAWHAACNAGFWGWLAISIAPISMGMIHARSWDDVVTILFLLAMSQALGVWVWAAAILFLMWPLMSLVKDRPEWWGRVRACACCCAVSFIILGVLSWYRLPPGEFLLITTMSLVMGIPAGLAAARYHQRHHLLTSPSTLP